MKSRRVCERLEVSRDGWGIPRFKALQVIIVSGNRRKLPLEQPWNGLSERVTKIGVLGAAAVAGPITGVHGELHEVGEPSDLLGACGFTARQRAKLVQVDGIGALRNQICVDECEVADFILGIVVDILVHVPVEHFKGSSVACTPAPPWDFAVLDASQFVVLLPQIAFDDFDRGQEPENATSPCVRRALPSWAKAGNPLVNSPVPMAPAPTTASPLRKKERRPVEYLDCCVLCFMILSFLRLLRVVSHYLLLIVVESIAATSQHLEMWVRWQSLNKCTKHAILHLVCSTLSREEC